MYTVVVTIHIIVCIILVLTVLLQQGKGAEVGAVFGSSEAMFGSAGPASALNKVTTVVAIIFMITSLALTYLAAHKKGDSVMEDVKVEAPVAPTAGPSSDTMPVHQRTTGAEVPADNEHASKSTVDNPTGDVVKAASTQATDAAASEGKEAVKSAADSAKAVLGGVKQPESAGGAEAQQ